MTALEAGEHLAAPYSPDPGAESATTDAPRPEPAPAPARGEAPVGGHGIPGPAEPSRTATAPIAVPEAAAERPATLWFRHNARDANYGKLARIRLAPGATAEVLPQFDCEVVHVAAGHGICLAADRGVVTTYAAKVFDAVTLTVSKTIPLAGLPSRTRVSPDGVLAATTVFVTGHGYDSVDFSTETLLIDLPTGELIGNVQDFAVTKDGTRFAAEDFNFWGVTFVGDRRHFYATLSTAGEHWLVRGDARARTATVVHRAVECPSLSPDGTRVAFKRRRPVSGSAEWQIMVMDLKTGRERVLAEQRSVDDQLEWLDVRTVLYALPQDARSGAAVTDVWSARVDGSRAPERLLANAYSPAVAR